MKTQKIEEWKASIDGFGGDYELPVYLEQLINNGKIIVVVVPTKYKKKIINPNYETLYTTIETALIITKEENG